jgi:hypothetical protein
VTGQHSMPCAATSQPTISPSFSAQPPCRWLRPWPMRFAGRTVTP